MSVWPRSLLARPRRVPDPSPLRLRATRVPPPRPDGLIKALGSPRWTANGAEGLPVVYFPDASPTEGTPMTARQNDGARKTTDMREACLRR